MGNIGSLLNMMRYLDIKTNVSSDISELKSAKRIILPGVGAFDTAMKRINETDGLKEVLCEKILVEKIPILGICLGMQLITNSSEEGNLDGLGWIDAETVKFPEFVDLKIPHMGWNEAFSYVRDNPLLKETKVDQKYYFVHSYHVKVKEENDSIMKTDYGIIFNSIVNRNNIFGVQFHPEKSHKFGMKILHNFSNI